jgi:hypothetical protein
MQLKTNARRTPSPTEGIGTSSPASPTHHDAPGTRVHETAITAPGATSANAVDITGSDCGQPTAPVPSLTLSSSGLGSTMPALYRYELSKRVHQARQRVSQRGGNAR